MESMIRDIGLAASGHDKIKWVQNFMPVLDAINKEFSVTKPFAGKKMVITMHLEAKTAYLALVFRNAGAQVAITGSNPLSTQDDVAAALVEDGLQVFACHGCSAEEYDVYINKALDTKPDIIVDDGGDLVSMLHNKRRELLSGIIGGSEETTTGVHRLHALANQGKLQFPMIAANDAYCKYLFDNRYGTGQSTWDGIMRTTNLVIAGKTVVIAGYGWCGKGGAMRAKGLGANVVITEVDPIKAIEAVLFLAFANWLIISISGMDSQLKQKISLSNAKFISQSSLPTPAKTTFEAGNPACKAAFISFLTFSGLDA